MTVCQFLCATVVGLVFDKNTDVTILYTATNGLLLLVSVGIYRTRKLSVLSHYILQKNLLILCAIVFDIILLTCCLIPAKENNIFFGKMGVILLGSGVLIICLAINLGKNILRNKQLETDNKMQSLYSESFEGLITEIRMRQHEFDNHINAILGLQYTCKDYAELIEKQKEYFNDISVENKYNKLLNAGNYAVVGFLYNKFIRMEAEGIEITYKIAAKQLECRTPVFILVEILGNLLDNAKDELIKTGSKLLYMSILETAEEITLEVGNESAPIPFEQVQSFFQKGKSSKGVNRGLGLYHVKKICEQYKMDIVCKNKIIDEHNYFSIQINTSKNVSGA